MNLPATGVTWDLGDLYRSPSDPAIVRDRQLALERAGAFGGEYRGRVAALNAPELRQALETLESISSLALRPLEYAQLMFAADTATPAHGAQLQAAQQSWSEVRQATLFFELEWVALEEGAARERLADPLLEHYRHFLERLRLRKPHLLGEGEERVVELMSNTGRHAFGRLFEEVVGGLRCRLPEEPPREITLPEALARLHDPERSVRAAAARAITGALQGQSRVLTFILNTLVQEHGDQQRLRHMPNPMHDRNLDNEISQAGVDALLAACESKMGIVARYYDLKRRLLGLESLTDYDRYAPLAAERPELPFEEAKEMVLEAYGAFSPRMADIAATFFTRHWIDAEPRPGKQGGAFSSGTLPEVHPYILMNYTGTARDVMTLAHELGHGVHQYLARPRGLFSFHAPLTTSETASTFGETLVFRSLLKRQPDDRAALALLCGKIEDSFATIFRQAIMTRFEQRLHAARAERGELDADAIGEIWIEANRAMFRGTVDLSQDYRSWWSYIPHFIRTPFYVYAYSFGELLALALVRSYDEQGAGFVPQYLDLLAAGASDAPQVLLGTLGLDIADPAFWQTGLGVLEGMVEQAEHLAGRAG